MRRLTGVFLALVLAATAADAATKVGSVTRLQGVCRGTSEGRTAAFAAGSPIHLGEVISTGPDARLELLFVDGTRLTLGERAKITIDRFVFHPDGGANRLKLGIAGAFRFVSGRLGKTAGATVGIATPVATVGVRGTDFWGGPIDGGYGVFLIEGSVVVANAGGQATLTRSGSGVGIPAPGEPPGAVSQWPQAKVARAIATVRFQ